jgi:hypothetical protein
MNPLCLLTKGRTFKDMADRSGAYKVLGSNAVPRYGSNKRLPSRISHPAPQTTQESLFEVPRVAVEVAVVEVPTAEVPVIPIVTAQPPEPVIPSPSPFAVGAIPAKKRSARGTWKQFVSFCKGWVKRIVFGKKRRPAHEASVQAELALEKVTVLRNDLNEDDLEVVLVERKVGTGEKPLARLSKMEMTAEAWIRLTAPFRKKDGESVISPQAESHPAPELTAQV